MKKKNKPKQRKNNRALRRKQARVLSGSLTNATFYLKVKEMSNDKPVLIQKGYEMVSSNGYKFVTIEDKLFRKKFWWKVRSWISPEWEAKVRVPARYV